MQYIDEFIIELEYVKNYSKNTIVSYQKDLYQFQEFIDKTSIENTTKPMIKNYIKENSNLKEKSLARKLSSLRMFFDFLIKKNYIKLNPMDGIDGPKIRKNIPDILSVDDIDKLLEFQTDNNFSYRNRCILELLYSTGLRISELVSLKLENVNLNESFIKVMGKGSKERIVPLNDITTEFLDTYIKDIRPSMLKKVQTDYLFLNNHGKVLTRQAVFKMIKKRAEEVNIQKNISPHTIRHSFATHLLQNGADIRFIQELLGHEDVGTTEIYTHVSNETLKSDYDHLNPRDN